MLICVCREEIQRIKASNPDISHREAFSTAAKNVSNYFINYSFEYLQMYFEINYGYLKEISMTHHKLKTMYIYNPIFF